MKLLRVFWVALGLAACGQLPSAERAASSPREAGEAFARAACAGCHSIAGHGMSPHRDAPPFLSIANERGVTAETLSAWLKDAHRYPEEMDFTLGEREVDDLVAYMLTLRDPAYRPPP